MSADLWGGVQAAPNKNGGSAMAKYNIPNLYIANREREAQGGGGTSSDTLVSVTLTNGEVATQWGSGYYGDFEITLPDGVTAEGKPIFAAYVAADASYAFVGNIAANDTTHKLTVSLCRFTTTGSDSKLNGTIYVLIKEV